jgi:hypothetical protein
MICRKKLYDELSAGTYQTRPGRNSSFLLPPFFHVRPLEAVRRQLATPLDPYQNRLRRKFLSMVSETGDPGEGFRRYKFYSRPRTAGSAATTPNPDGGVGSPAPNRRTRAEPRLLGAAKCQRPSDWLGLLRDGAHLRSVFIRNFLIRNSLSQQEKTKVNIETLPIA